MKKDTSHTIKRAQRFPVILIGEGLLVGAVGGLIVLLYRVALTYAGIWLEYILDFVRGNPIRTAGWFLALMLMAFVVGKLVKWEPMISGSGIPQVEGEVTGKLFQNWKKVLPAKFIGGFLCLFGGLSLGREGPSIQLGAMTGQGISRLLDRGKTEEKYLMTCGASAGLAAAFHAPLAGMMFALEEIHKGFSISILISVMTASVTADFISSYIIGLDPVFQFRLEHVLPQQYYWMLILLGVILGAMGAFYNWAMLKAQDLYKKPAFLNETTRLMIAFFAAGVLGLLMPSVLGSGHELIVSLTDGEMALGLVILTFFVKFIFSAVSFGSGAPGGIFFPLLILGAMIGGIFAMTGVQFFGLDPVYINNFVLLAMAGYFTAIVRAPITGIILLFEMSGSVSQMLSLAIVSVTAYIIATLLKSEPIYESLLDRILKTHHKATAVNVKGSSQKVLSTFVIMNGSVLEGKMVQDITWPDNCLLVALERGGKELIPKGKTVLMAGDTLTTMTDERDAGYVHDKMEKLCYTSF
ncbi:ClC family H(+)/Cl(-) exchange transporter [Faecalicatena sp. AGMB00832]|uniref:ClC family H(+)/Cl(-) exchange transporter n=1 Tax=Faecalicatena faecalis TaxID=2726362 RepID=A0ABS6D3M4_9FIRM|nr:ClC family H(+)/Cl(-) exchange transporter [Faecalicatena faecalis]MBU3876197.1 ClC family H(+)/Cl(-) exchange transporter [Faecalicatena faecalis]